MSDLRFYRKGDKVRIVDPVYDPADADPGFALNAVVEVTDDSRVIIPVVTPSGLEGVLMPYEIEPVEPKE